jgi:excisionase family DNA binding protein
MERLLSIKEVSELLGLSVRRVHALAREGKLGYVSHSSRNKMFTEAQVQDYIRSKTITPPPKVIDGDRRKGLQPPPQVQLKTEGGSVRAQIRALREEMRSWQ